MPTPTQHHQTAHFHGEGAWSSGHTSVTLATFTGPVKLTHVEWRGLVTYDNTATAWPATSYFTNEFGVGISITPGGQAVPSPTDTSQSDGPQWISNHSLAARDVEAIAAFSSIGTGAQSLVSASTMSEDLYLQRELLPTSAGIVISWGIDITTSSAGQYRVFAFSRVTWSQLD
jgi:hypothetical protein